LFAFLFSSSAFAQQLRCPPGQYLQWNGQRYACIGDWPAPPRDCVVCQQNYQAHYPYNPNWFSNFPPAIYQPQPMPWWASQGNMYYPNLHYPGAWRYPGINQNYYPGNGQVHALKPNIYVESIHHDKKFVFSFGTKEKKSFLATTPMLED